MAQFNAMGYAHLLNIVKYWQNLVNDWKWQYISNDKSNDDGVMVGISQEISFGHNI